MPKLDITGELTVEEIHKIREYNYEMTKDMTWDERWEYYRKGAEPVLKMLNTFKYSTATV
jgi:hypothetical protein